MNRMTGTIVPARVRCICVALTAVLSSAAASALAQARAPAAQPSAPTTPAAASVAPRTVAAFFLVKDGADPALVTASKEFFNKADTEIASIEWLVDARVAARFRQAGLTGIPMAAVLGCGSDLGCMADLGAKIGVDEVALVRVQPKPEVAGLVLAYVSVDVKSRALARRQRLEVTALAEVTSVLRNGLESVWGVSLPAEQPQPAAAALAAAPPPPPPPPSQETTTAWWRNHAIARYAALGLSGVDALVLGGALVSGVKAHSKRGDLTSSTDQIAAVAIERDVNRAASRANTLFVVGGVLTLLTAAAWGWDLYGIDWLYGAQLAVTTDGSTAHASWTVRW